MMRGTWFVVMSVIMSGVLMSVCESSRISMEIAKERVPQEANDWKDTACSWCAYSQNPQDCVRICRRALPGLTQEDEANDWKDTACGWCAYSQNPQDCVRICRRALPGLTQEDEANAWNKSLCSWCAYSQNPHKCAVSLSCRWLPGMMKKSQ